MGVSGILWINPRGRYS